jgi:hypothetical protein
MRQRMNAAPEGRGRAGKAPSELTGRGPAPLLP